MLATCHRPRLCGRANAVDGRFRQSGRAAIFVMQAVQHRESNDLARSWFSALRWPIWHMLIDPLMRPGFVEVCDLRRDHSPEVPFPEDQQVIHTLAPYTTDESLRDGI